MLAPGEGIYSTFMDGGYKLMWGTSMACPMVAGAAALLQAAALRWVGLRARLRALEHPCPCDACCAVW